MGCGKAGAVLSRMLLNHRKQTSPASARRFLMSPHFPAFVRRSAYFLSSLIRCK